MIRSMTGFGRGENLQDGKEFTVEIKTVNHRYSDVSIRMPRQIGFLEERVRELVSKAISRGKADVYITYQNHSDDLKQVTLDEALAKTYISAVEALRDKYDLKDDISVSLISRYPDVLKVDQAKEDEDLLWSILKVSVDMALDALVTMREIEGEALKKVLLERADCIADVVAEIAKRAPDVPKEYKLKLTARIKELLDQHAIDENRLEMEVALFADKCSVDEELVRLKSHIRQLKEALTIVDQPVGRKLDFLVQEMNREINTIGSKANDLSITKDVVDVKSEIEKIREQIQNIE